MKQEYIEFVDYFLILDNEPRLKNINLKIKNNIILTIIGPSRSGKVNFLRSLNLSNQLYHKVETRGQLLVNNNNILETQDIVKLRRKHAYISAQPIMLNGTVWDNLVIGLKIHKIPEKFWYNYIKYALELLVSWEKFKDMLETDIKKLSKLEQLIISFARIIVLNPEIILVEDFTRYLDHAAFLEFADTFIKLKRKFTIFMVCYDIKYAAKLGTYTLLLKDGRVVEMNETQRFFSKPDKAETEVFLNGIA